MHRELHQWRDRAVAVQKQIGDQFDRSAQFKPELQDMHDVSGKATHHL